MLGWVLDMRHGLVRLFRGDLTPSVMLVEAMPRSLFNSLVLGRMMVRLPDDSRVFVNDRATIDVNFYDHYVRREYMRHPNYVPGGGWGCS